jgi:hypothetical protein
MPFVELGGCSGTPQVKKITNDPGLSSAQVRRAIHNSLRVAAGGLTPKSFYLINE